MANRVRRNIEIPNEACKILEITNNFITNNPNNELIRISFQNSPQ